MDALIETFVAAAEHAETASLGKARRQLPRHRLIEAPSSGTQEIQRSRRVDCFDAGKHRLGRKHHSGTPAERRVVDGAMYSQPMGAQIVDGNVEDSGASGAPEKRRRGERLDELREQRENGDLNRHEQPERRRAEDRETVGMRDQPEPRRRTPPPSSSTRGPSGPVATTWVSTEHAGRLDKAMRKLFPQWSRAAVDLAIGQRRVRINNRVVWMSSWEVVKGDRIDVDEPPVDKASGPTEFDPRWLISDEGDLLVVDKPAGLRSEPVRATDATSNLLTLAQDAYGEELVLAHRLDRDTSGLVLLTRPGAVRKAIAAAFSAHTIEKRYVAVVRAPNDLADEGTIRTRIAKDPKRADHMLVVEKGGDLATTKYAVVDRGAASDRVDLWPHTGRTHQLRVHCAYMAAPIIGDPIYSSDSGPSLAPRLLLHATELTLPPLAEVPTLIGKYSSPAPF